MTKIIAFGIRDEERPIVEAWANKANVEVKMLQDILTEKTIYQVEGYDGVTLSQVAPLEQSIYAKLEAFGIKQIAQRSAGVDMYDLEMAKRHHLIVSNVPTYSPESIAEWSALTAMNLIRHYDAIQEQVKKHNFSWTPNIRGRVIGNMTVAIIGTGHIGQCVAQIFKGMGAKIVGYDLYPNDELKDLLEYQSSIEQAVEQADIVSLHIPAIEENHHLFDEKMFKKFKQGAVLLNMARGSVIDTTALLNALDEGILLGAGLDTYEHEAPYIPKDFSDKEIEDEVFVKVLDHPKVIYSPHIAFYTDESVKNLVEGGLNATLDVIKTGTTKNRVN
ncbi:D-2-hydroxyacid dehydrogenase [Facklamia sp. P12945]|uniref:D-2-hydroxyacid dehydrogenase n=1 Tax=unclassified Facklamia TaxID=2622293 RepID=UPI003D17ACC0